MYPLPHPLPGTQWRLLSLLGAGGHAEVYLAEHVELEHRVAVKLLQAKHSARSELIVRLRQEARILAKLRDCAAIVAVHDFGKSDDGRAYFVMDHVAGRSLRQTMNHRKRAFAVEEACAIVAEAADGLAIAHDAGIVHRDIKPENVMLAHDHRVKLVDFGVAKAMQESGLTGTHTAGGFVVGTPHYMAPEQAMGRPVSAQTDLYALGCVLFELITASKVFEGEPIDVIRAHARKAPPTLGECLGRAVPHELESIVRGLLAKELDRRFRSGREVAEQLRRFLSLRPRSSRRLPLGRVAQALDDVLDEATDVDSVHSRPTIRTASRPPPEAQPTTRSVPAASILVGVATTERFAAPPGPVGSLPTEVVPAVRDERDTTSPVQVPSPLLAEALQRAAQRSASDDDDLELLDDATTLVHRPRTRRLGTLFLGGAVAVGVCVGATVLVSLFTAGRARTTTIAPSPRLVEPGPAALVAADSARPSPHAAAPATSAKPSPPTTSSPTTSPSAKATTAPAPAVAPSAADDASSTYAKALQAFRAGDYQTAESDARKAGASPSARLLLAQILEREGKTTTAHAIYEEILHSDPSMIAAFEGLERTGG